MNNQVPHIDFDAVATTAERVKQCPCCHRQWQNTGYPDEGIDHPHYWDWCLKQAERLLS